MARGVCPITREEFAEHAPTITVTIEGQTFECEPKPVTDGKSLGYWLSKKCTITVNGKDVDFQIGLNITAVHSKEKHYS